MAQCVQDALVEAGGRTNLGLKEERFVVLRETDMPSILIETAFISNPTEEGLLANGDYRQTMAEGIANGIRAYFEESE